MVDAISYRDYYKKFLRYDGTEMAYCQQRDLPLNHSYFYRVIATYINGKAFYSISSQIKSFKIKETIEKTLEDNQGHFKLRIFYRMRLASYNKPLVNHSRAFSYKDLDKLDHLKRAGVIEKYKDILEEGRRFVIYESGSNVGYAIISDIDFDAGNIVVYVKPEHRNKGYAKMLVASCIEWCLNHDLLPLYLVDKENLASRRLAESLGFVSFSTEYVLSEKIGNI